MKVFNFVLGALVGIGLVITFKPAIAKPAPEVRTVVETKIVTEKEIAYVSVNKTEPIDMIATAYTSGAESTGKQPGMKDYGITSTGTNARVGVCAVDPKYVPLGSSLFVEGYGYCRAEDTGGAVKGYHVDVFMNKVADANKFGNESHKVWILKNFGD